MIPRPRTRFSHKIYYGKFFPCRSPTGICRWRPQAARDQPAWIIHWINRHGSFMGSARMSGCGLCDTYHIHRPRNAPEQKQPVMRASAIFRQGAARTHPAILRLSAFSEDNPVMIRRQLHKFVTQKWRRSFPGGLTQRCLHILRAHAQRACRSPRAA